MAHELNVGHCPDAFTFLLLNISNMAVHIQSSLLHPCVEGEQRQQQCFFKWLFVANPISYKNWPKANSGHIPYS
jgi:hypothetical protein